MIREEFINDKGRIHKMVREEDINDKRGIYK